MNKFFQWVFKSKKEDKWLNEQRLLKHFHVPELGQCRTVIANTPLWLREFFAFQERDKIRDKIEDFIRKEYPGDTNLKSEIYKILK